EKDSATILDDSSSLLEQVADTLARNPAIAHVEIQGHTDDSGTPDHNKSLSEARANAVLEWLVAHGIDATRLSARGFGQERPISPNLSPQGRARNRRGQLTISHGRSAPPSPNRELESRALDSSISIVGDDSIRAVESCRRRRSEAKRRGLQKACSTAAAPSSRASGCRH